MARTTQIKNARREARDAREREEMQADPFVNDDNDGNDEDDVEDEDGPPEVDPYAVLGLETEATADDVKKAYRKLALQHHPGTKQYGIRL
jgi:DnaJ family protein C protein 9